MIDFLNSNITQVSAHYVGNKALGENNILSPNSLNIDDPQLRELLLKYFLSNFSLPEYYSFTFSNGDFHLNPIFNFASRIFDRPTTLHEQSKNLAKHLYESTNHPNILTGDFYVAFFSNVKVDSEVLNAIGIFKSETKDSYLKSTISDNQYVLAYERGININKVDKGCLIFDTEAETGFKVCVLDKTNKSETAQYWKEIFLNITPRSDSYHSTQNFLAITKSFVTQQLPEEFELSKTDKIDFLNRSLEYFKKHDNFDLDDFGVEVFHDPKVIKSFKDYDTSYREENNLDTLESFEISPQAVKKQARVFKSVLKLDKNFHIYIHGDRNLIEQGTDADGRKYYKIYYSQET